MQVYETCKDHSMQLGNLSVTLKQVSCDVPKDDELYGNEERTCSESWLKSLLKELQFIIRWQFSVLELCADFSDTFYPSSTPTQNDHKGCSPVGLVEIKILPQTV
jgi:hypothetical protein